VGDLPSSPRFFSSCCFSTPWTSPPHALWPTVFSRASPLHHPYSYQAFFGGNLCPPHLPICSSLHVLPLSGVEPFSPRFFLASHCGRSQPESSSPAKCLLFFPGAVRSSTPVVRAHPLPERSFSFAVPLANDQQNPFVDFAL